MFLRFLPMPLALGVLCTGVFNTACAQLNYLGNSTNPLALGIVLDGRYQSLSNDPQDYALQGFQLSDEAGPGDQGFYMEEIELTANGNVDDFLFAQFTAAMADTADGTEVDIEEAYAETSSLGNGFRIRGGRFFSDLGYLNAYHKDAWSFADAPLIYRALFGDKLRDDGIQISWTAPTDIYLQTLFEYTRGAGFPAAGSQHNGRGARTAVLNLGGDVGVSHSWLTGLSYWTADVAQRAGTDFEFSGDSNITAFDAVWKWAPQGNPHYKNLKLLFEYLHRNEDGALHMTDGRDSLYDGRQNGWFAQAAYQFMPRWRVGLRYDRIKADNQGSDLSVMRDTGLASSTRQPQRASLMLEYARSEFSRLRLQYNRDESTEVADNQFIAQFIVSLGAHGAHPF